MRFDLFEIELVWERSFSGPLVDPNIDAYCLAPTDVTVHIDQQAFAYNNGSGGGYVRVDAPYCTQTKDTVAMTRYVVDFATGDARTIALSSASATCRARCVQFVPP